MAGVPYGQPECCGSTLGINDSQRDFHQVHSTSDDRENMQNIGRVEQDCAFADEAVALVDHLVVNDDRQPTLPLSDVAEVLAVGAEGYTPRVGILTLHRVVADHEPCLLRSAGICRPSTVGAEHDRAGADSIEGTSHGFIDDDRLDRPPFRDVSDALTVRAKDFVSANNDVVEGPAASAINHDELSSTIDRRIQQTLTVRAVDERSAHAVVLRTFDPGANHDLLLPLLCTVRELSAIGAEDERVLDDAVVSSHRDAINHDDVLIGITGDERQPPTGAER